MSNYHRWTNFSIAVVLVGIEFLVLTGTVRTISTALLRLTGDTGYPFSEHPVFSGLVIGAIAGAFPVRLLLGILLVVNKNTMKNGRAIKVHFAGRYVVFFAAPIASLVSLLEASGRSMHSVIAQGSGYWTTWVNLFVKNDCVAALDCFKVSLVDYFFSVSLAYSLARYLNFRYRKQIDGSLISRAEKH